MCFRTVQLSCIFVNAALAEAKQQNLIIFVPKNHYVFVISLKHCLEMERLVLQYLHQEIEEIMENGFDKGLFRRVPIASICCPVQ